MLGCVPIAALQALARFWWVTCLAVCAPGGEVLCHRLTSFLVSVGARVNSAVKIIDDAKQPVAASASE